MTIGERLLKLRRDKNISQEELANELDVSRQTISKWETDQSLPDSDKIVPLCNYFGITSDELLTGNKNIVEKNSEDNKKKFARNIAIAVMLYIMSLVSIIVCSGLISNDIVGIASFFTLIALGTGLIIYSAIVYGEKKEKVETKQDKHNKRLSKQIEGVVGILGVTVYLLVSFMTGAWHITWIIFLIIGIINQIIKLLFTIFTKEEGDIDE